jgi:hypothetical protein
VRLVIDPSVVSLETHAGIIKVWLETPPTQDERWHGSLEARIYPLETESPKQGSITLIGSISTPAKGTLKGNLQRLPSVAVASSTPVYFDVSELGEGRFRLVRSFRSGYPAATAELAESEAEFQIVRS